MKTRLLLILVLVAAGGAAIFVSIGGLPGAATASASDYLTAPVTTGDVTDQVAATGSIASDASYALGFGAAPVLVTDTSSTPQAGSGTWRVAEVPVKVGQTVKAGDVVAKASTKDIDRQIVSAQTSLDSARIQESQARTTLDDVTGTAIDQAMVAWKSAVNARRQAQQALTDLKNQLHYAVLRAPIDGIVTAVNVQQGLDATGTALTIASTTYQVTADVVETDISTMTVGQPATVSVGAINAVIQGKVAAIAPAAASSSSGSNSVVSFPVTVTLTGAPTTLRTGMTADITIVTASATNVLMVPASALRGTNGSYRVQVMGADGTPTPVDVTVGLVTNTAAEIKSGLQEGQVVVTGTRSAQQQATNNGGGFGGGGFAIPGGGGGRNTFTRP